MILKHVVTAEEDGLQAGLILKKVFQISRQLNKKIRHEGSLTRSGQPARMVDPCRKGDLLEACYTAPGEMPPGLRLKSRDDILILYEDDHLIVADKPAPLLTHPAYKGQEDSLITLLGGHYNLHPVSRLDRQTSGLVLLAKNGFIHDRLSRTDIVKIYCGFVYGLPQPAAGSFTQPIRRRVDSIILRETTSAKDPAGQPAKTDYKVACSYTVKLEERAVSKLYFRLWTGRTHQIRVHCQAAGHPLLGDGLYGFGDRISSKTPSPSANSRSFQDRAAGEAGPIKTAVIEACESLISRQALHACKLAFQHPLTGQLLEVESALRSDLFNLEKKLASQTKTLQ